MKNKYFLIAFFCLVFSSIQGQILTGTVSNDTGDFLFGATIVWDGTSIGAVADENGYFELPKQDTVANLKIDYVGYDPIYVEVLPTETEVTITIDGLNELMEIEVAAKKRDNYISTLSTLNLEVMGAGEFRKAPCCNLAESFSTNASIDVAYSDAITGAREIRLLGLRGTYTQLLIEKRPILTGLGSAFVMEYIPGTWLSSIQISKGTSTVQNGFQAITGQINSELVKPFEDKRFFVNLYGSTFGRGEANIHLNHKFSDKWSSGLLLHASTRQNEMDNNEDTFYDTPQKTMYDALWRTFYRGNVLRSQFNIHVLSDRHQAGQILTTQLQNPYQISQENDRIEFFGKVGYLGFKNLTQTVGFIADAAWHKLDAHYGNKHHFGTQQNIYLNGMFSTGLGNEQHKLDLGFNYNYDNYDEHLDDKDLSRMESVPGVFAEYSLIPKVRPCDTDPYNFEHKFGLIAGARVDHHNLFGWLFTPRANIKYNFSDDRVVRVSAGRGYRSANVIAENISTLASNRNIVLLEDLKMEDAWNFGFNFTENFKIKDREASFSTDLYHTTFNNQVIMDLNSDYQLVQFYNLNGKSYANSLLSVFSYEIVKGIDIKFAYKYNDVKITFLDGELQEKPMVAKHRGLVNLDLATADNKWEMNINSQLVGKQNFVNLTSNPEHNNQQHIGETPAYTIFNAQLTRRFGENFEIYAGCENLTNYTQEDPIIDWQNPFGNNFDASHVYAPISGAMGFIGIRYGIE